MHSDSAGVEFWWHKEVKLSGSLAGNPFLFSGSYLLKPHLFTYIAIQERVVAVVLLCDHDLAL